MSIYQRTEYDRDNQFDWTSIQYTIENDVVIGTRTLFDAGYEVFGTYENGILIKESYSNTLNSLGFVNRTIEYDTNGEITYRSTAFPDYFGVREYFENGIPTETKLKDGFVGSGVKPWDEMIFSYDENGNIISRETKFDDGRSVTEEFELGVRETLQDFAQKKPWETIDTSYDENGNKSERKIVYDNGIVKQELFEDGKRVQVIMRDNPDVDGDGVKNWSSIDTSYDQNGKMIKRVTDFDNGINRLEIFEDGQRVSTVHQDLDNVKNWHKIETLYDAGKITQKRVDYDNGDINISLYSDGVRTQILQYDGDDSASWQLQVVDILADGEREITRYASFDEIPAELLNYFPDLIPVVEPTEYTLDFEDGVTLYDGDTVLEDTFVVNVERGSPNSPGALSPNEYGGVTTPDTDLEAYNSWAATIGFSMANGEDFDFKSLSLANCSRSDTTSIPENNWANKVTINGYDDGVIVNSIEIDLTFDHINHDLNWEDIDYIEFVASGGGVTNDYVENGGWFSMDDLVFIA